METAWLEVFRAIARTGSFTAAAKDLGYTQSAISRHVAALESEMDAVLFHRLARGVRLTEPGRFLLGHAEAVLARLNEAKKDIGDVRRLAAGRVRVGSFATVGVTLVPQAIARFTAAHPDVTVTHLDDLTRQLAPRVARDELDVAVLNGYPPQIAALPPLSLRKLCDEPMSVALPAGHRLADRRRVRLTELADENWIAGNPTPEDTLISAALRQGFAPRIAYVAREWTAKQGFVAAGLGVTLIPALAAASIRPDIALVPVDSATTPVRGIYAATAPEIEPAPAVRAFVDVLCAQAERLVKELNIQIPGNRN
ncbi:LysR family transcriptional regulator [Stackebrandtia nassauensis]|uniref:Transcriptional regulator, LysR family n=1 Tax=Stackebrandtia nassauensis (strain DSM 44728 / CIP 108903 / NRRL B-16338 / NBRC 102104 / LLR-40K-21) TaxID=446470 RepID=D3PZQ6_STANL|nr:LysR family transcriptional regulator [Stackebrandtia nassauensis]ADD43593.1 transcriptional regulator, LysR family [Stackebrandtia nassauensis DSM 44728]